MPLPKVGFPKYGSSHRRGRVTNEWCRRWWIEPISLLLRITRVTSGFTPLCAIHIRCRAKNVAGRLGAGMQGEGLGDWRRIGRKWPDHRFIGLKSKA